MLNASCVSSGTVSLFRFRRDSLSAGGALELEAACVSLLEAAQAPQKEGEGAMAILRRMSALKAAVDLTTGRALLLLLSALMTS